MTKVGMVLPWMIWDMICWLAVMARGFFLQGEVVLPALFLNSFLLCFVLDCFDGADGDVLRVFNGCSGEKKPLAIVAKVLKILFGFIGPIDEIRFFPLGAIVAPDLLLLDAVQNQIGHDGTFF